MSDDSASAAVPVLDQHDRAAVLAILIRAVRLKEEVAEDERLLAEVNERLAAARLARVHGIQALRVFGFAGDSGIWDRVKVALGSDDYQKAFDVVRQERGRLVDDPVVLLPNLFGPQPALPDEFEERRATELGGAGEDTAQVNVAEAILEMLTAVGVKGARLSEISTFLLANYGMNLHPRTPAMTLSRLAKQGKVVRSNRLWFLSENVPDSS